MYPQHEGCARKVVLLRGGRRIEKAVRAVRFEGESLVWDWVKEDPVFCLRLISILSPSRPAPTHSALLWSALLWAPSHPCLALSLQAIKSPSLRIWVPL